MSEKYQYDLVVIGSGPGGQKAAIQAGKLGKRALIIDYNPFLGGVCLHDGTIPSKSFREAIIHLSGHRLKNFFGRGYRVKQNIQMEDLTSWADSIIKEIEQTLRDQLVRNGVEIMCGMGDLIDPHKVRITHENQQSIVTSEFILLASGSRPRRPPGFDVDNEIILDSSGILSMENLPRTMTVVGGGVIGSEYGSMFAALGVNVTIVEERPSILSFVDRELVETLVYHLKDQRATVLVNEKVVRCTKSSDGRAVTYLESGKRLVSEVLLVCAGRVGNVEKLNLDKVGIKPDERNYIPVNDFYQTSVPNIYAAGDVIGKAALASTSIEQGRRAACHAFGIQDGFERLPEPYGIYSIPEIAMVGKTEADLSAAHVPYETGLARFADIERGKITGDDTGVLKILFHRVTHKILGVHIIGENATELIHTAQAVLATEGTIHYFVNAVFNYPTLSQAYKVAALAGINKIIATRDLPEDVP